MANIPQRAESDGGNRPEEKPEVTPLSEFTTVPFRSERSLYLTFSRDVYSLKALLAAAYKFSDSYAVWVDTAADGRWAVVFIAERVIDHELVMTGFVKELVDQQLREALEKEFGSLRTLIVAQAFAEGNLLESHLRHEHGDAPGT